MSSDTSKIIMPGPVPVPMGDLDPMVCFLGMDKITNASHAISMARAVCSHVPEDNHINITDFTRGETPSGMMQASQEASSKQMNLSLAMGQPVAEVCTLSANIDKIFHKSFESHKIKCDHVEMPPATHADHKK